MDMLAKDRVPLQFDAVAHRYDLLQRLNPGYRGDLRRSAQRLGARDDARILDLCCGTGLSTQALRGCYPRAKITALDASRGMLDAARVKPDLSDVHFVLGDAHDPGAAGVHGPFDAVFMAYGIRNMGAPDRCLGNVLQLLEAGGKVAFHEYLLTGSAASRAVWNVVSGAIIMPLGWAASGSGELFSYLRTSVLEFDRVGEFEARLQRVGFEDVEVGRMRGWQRGILHTVVARKPH